MLQEQYTLLPDAYKNNNTEDVSYGEGIHIHKQVGVDTRKGGLIYCRGASSICRGGAGCTR